MPFSMPVAGTPRQSPQSIVPAILLLFVVALAGCGLIIHRDLPRDMAGLPETFSARGGGGLAEVRRLHGQGLDIQSGAFAIYGGGAETLWVASARDTVTARELVREMTARIAAGDSPFRTDTSRIAAGREIHVLSGLGQHHYFFRAGKRVVWVAANRREAEAALSEALKFYPPAGR
jgi:hypothetical protein